LTDRGTFHELHPDEQFSPHPAFVAVRKKVRRGTLGMRGLLLRIPAYEAGISQEMAYYAVAVVRLEAEQE
jgi:hypothetical protein